MKKTFASFAWGAPAVSDSERLAARRKTMPRLAPATAVDSPRARILEDLRKAPCAQKFSPHAERTYCHWVIRYIYFHDLRHPAEMAEDEVNEFLTHLWVKEKVSAATQNEAISVLAVPLSAGHRSGPRPPDQGDLRSTGRACARRGSARVGLRRAIGRRSAIPTWSLPLGLCSSDAVQGDMRHAIVVAKRRGMSPTPVDDGSSRPR